MLEIDEESEISEFQLTVDRAIRVDQNVRFVPDFIISISTVRVEGDRREQGGEQGERRNIKP